MSQPWSAVEANPKYQSMTPDMKQAAKLQYFNDVVAPQVPKSGLTDARNQFLGTGAGDGVSPAYKFAQDRTIDPAAMSIEEGYSFGAGDEIMAAMTAADAGIHNMYKKITGKPIDYSMGEVYDSSLEQNRQRLKNFSSEYPKGHELAGEVIGGALNPASKLGGGWVADAPGALGKIARGALVGAPAGAIAGFNSGEGGLANRSVNAGIGTAIGSGIGMIPGAVGGAGRVVGNVGVRAAKAFRNALHDLSGKTPEEAAKSLSPKELASLKDQAIQIVKDTITSAGHKISDLTEDPAHKLGKPITAAETSAPLTNLAKSVARRGGETGDLAESQFRLRGEERGDRIMGDLAQASGLKPEHVQGNMDNLSDELRAKNEPRYTKAYTEPAPNMKDPELKAIMKQDNFKQAFALAKKSLSNKGKTLDINNMSWEDLDKIKRLMGANITRKHTNQVGQFISDEISRDDLSGLNNYRDWLFKNNSAYKDAVQHGGEPIKLEAVYKDASRLMSSRVNESQFDKKVNDLSPAEVDALKAGWVNDVYNKLRKDKLQPKDLKSGEFLAKAKRLLGESQARRFVDSIQQELRLKQGEQSIPPKTGSQTAPLLHAGEELDQKSDEMIQDFAQSWNRRGIPFAVRRAAINAMYNVFRAVKTPERESLRNEIGKLTLLKPDQLRQTIEQHGKVKGGVSQKAKEIMQMVSHLGNSAAPVLSETGTQEITQ